MLSRCAVPADAPQAADDDPRRNHYRLTRLGRQEPRQEAEKLEAMVRQPGQRAVLPEATS